MPRRLIDISSPLKAGIKSDPPHALPKIEYLDHHQTAPAMAEYMGVSVDQLPGGEYAAVERCRDQHAQRHASRRALPLLLHHEPRAEAGRRAVLAHRRGAAGVVLSAGGEAGLPASARRLRRDARRHRGRAEAHRPYAASSRDRGGEHGGRGEVRAGRLRRLRLRRRQGGDLVDAGARGAPGRHRRLELGRALLAHPAQGGRDRRRRPDLGRPSRGPRDRLFPSGEAAQSRAIAGGRLRGRVLSRQDPPRVGGLDAGGGDPAG